MKIASGRRGVIGVLALLLATSAPLSAHPVSGVLRVASPQLPVGGALVLFGTKFETSTDLRLVLRAALHEYVVGTVKSDAAGAFTATLTLPAGVPAGAYTLLAVAPDGDIGARADVTIVPAAASSLPSMPGMPLVPGMEWPGPMAQATDRKMPINQSETPLERTIVAALVLLGLGGGVILLRRAAAIEGRGDTSRGVS